MQLSQLMGSYPAQALVLCTDEGESYTKEDLLGCVRQIQNQYPTSFADQTVVLFGLPVYDLLAHLIVLDGTAQSILLLPASVGEEVCSQLAAEVGADVLLYVDPVSQQVAARRLTEHAEQTLTADTARTTNWYLATSGTTATPKLIKHTLRTLTRETATALQQRHDLVWGMVYDPVRFAGLQVLLHAVSHGCTMVVPRLDHIQGMLDLFVRHNVTALSATPSMWRKLLMAGSLGHLNLRQITLGGEIVDQSILDQLRHIFPAAKIAHIYASTEAGSALMVTDGLAGFPVLWLSQEKSGSRLKIQQDKLWIKSAKPASGQEVIARLDPEGYLDTGDLVQIIGDRVHFLGRESGAINVGGNKVIPEDIERVILAVEGVDDVTVFGKKSSVIGQIVVAKVIPSDLANPAETKARIVKQCKDHLQSWQVPAMIQFVHSLPVTPAGKKDRRSV